MVYYPSESGYWRWRLDTKEHAGSFEALKEESLRRSAALLALLRMLDRLMTRQLRSGGLYKMKHSMRWVRKLGGEEPAISHVRFGLRNER